MRRREDRGHNWLSDDASPWTTTPDPDEVNAELKDLLAVHSGTVYDACWWHTDVFAVDPDEQEKYRRRQILSLSRYGRFGGGVHDWDDEPVSELSAWYRELVEMVNQEGAVAASFENG